MVGTGLLKGLGVTFKEMWKPKVTTKYPDEPYELPNRFRGIQKLYVDKCIVCYQCAHICPTQCITIKEKPKADPKQKKKELEAFDINFEICILCDLCTEVCPTEAIVMTSNVELAEYRRDALHKDMRWLEANNTNIRELNLPWKATSSSS
ncbi:NADH-quinone oxidoreductase subunit NuoI [Hydrogenibacillus sp. N12]|uniref:NADH-quinone oxidoreductase subunit NuoI n=1 Tax=Hydrogenibacillus sp. N12 TaxID=2866627 RepID=UPI001C7DB992|nr:NADH-quinone oxidoreductase subunit NuoI [Hydrogenibacillus sp. N12]QZA33537.1 NADH-quinone oxidoreductase subunit NuoI [Hydrogenibacillus sp. N12]